MKRISLIVAVGIVAIGSLIAQPVLAQWTYGQPIVPCGLSQNHPATSWDDALDCTPCDLFRLIRNIIDFILIGLMPPLATLFFVWAGFLWMLGGANPSWYSQARSIFSTTFWGVVIILLSWVMTNTLLASIATAPVTFTLNNGGSYVWNPLNWWQVQCLGGTGGTLPPPVTPTPSPGGGPVALTITTASLQDGVMGQAYSQTLGAGGGTTPYQWSVTSGTLPTGLVLNPATGAISGTPTALGTFMFSVMVRDASSPAGSATRNFTVTITSAPTAQCSDLPALAASNNVPYPRQQSPELQNLLSCIASRLGQPMPSDGGVNGYYGSLYTFERANEVCNYTRGARTCSASCAHSQNSCHYGGATGTQGSMAVDLGNEANGNAIVGAAIACGVPAIKARCESAGGAFVSCTGGMATHVHISTAGCDRN